MTDLRRDLTDGVLTLTLNRPERMNALSRRLKSCLLEAIDFAARSPDVAVVVITGEGDRAFCAGRDLKELREEDESLGKASNPAPMGGVERNLYEALLELYKPTIASINGAAVGGGFEMALACDLRVAAAGVKIGLPEARRGMGANFGSAVLPRLLPRAIAFELLYTAELVVPEDLADYGIFNRIVERESLAETTRQLATTIAGNAPLTLQRYKHLATKTWGMPLTSSIRLDVGPDAYGSEDRREGVRAFVEGREPVWTGR